jgi:hypothetical protein
VIIITSAEHLRNTKINTEHSRYTCNLTFDGAVTCLLPLSWYQFRWERCALCFLIIRAAGDMRANSLFPVKWLLIQCIKSYLLSKISDGLHRRHNGLISTFELTLPKVVSMLQGPLSPMQHLQLIYVHYNIPSVHCAGLLDVQGASQKVLSADTVVSPGKLKVIHLVITWLLSQLVLCHRVL